MSTHVLVLGAGMVGVSTALALQQRGHHVTLVDRNARCLETSYGNAGIIQREAVRPYGFPREWRAILRVASGRGNEAHYHLGGLPGIALRLARYWAHSAPAAYAPIAEAYERLIAHCLTEHARWMDECGAQDLVSRNGWLQSYRTPAVWHAAAAEALRVADRAGLDCAVLDGAALAAAQPALQAPMAGAIHWKDAWSVSEPAELVERYAALFVKKGGVVLVGDARTLRQQGRGWAVDTASGSVDAEHAVLALGPWSDQATRALGYKLPLFVKRGYHRHYRRGATLALPMLDMEQGVMLAPMKRGIRITTGAEFAPLDAPSTPVQLHRAEQSTRSLLDLGEPVEAQPWRGARPCTVDMKPVIGAAARHRGLWFNFGHAHQGFTLGPVCGRLLAELMSGETPIVDPEPYSPARF
ncbi:FAD-binding oxidoreductase [Schlegelella sp. S2-27]|uniref:FAD-binding oxidoreductase n=1 Tax=Caldimonas mangrovi TaxID=2944811 RepID=A0ABT0YMT4_9BURK|nr:FAD-binding oxidoreductase [Caldimonas mangrovi]MCM5680037.1 FAD-binding oxidoreductase [Caldimonas mangrovi]